MNKDAKIGLFAVLILVVLVAVMWAKLAGSREEPSIAKDNSARTGDTGDTGEKLAVTNNNTGDAGNTGDVGTPFKTGDAGNTGNLGNTGNTGNLGNTGADTAYYQLFPEKTNVTGPVNDGELKISKDTTDKAIDAVTVKEHKILKDETLSEIARRNGTTVQAILDANKGKIVPTRLKIGAMIIIPGAPAKKDDAEKVVEEKMTPEKATEKALEKVVEKVAEKVGDAPKAGENYKVKKNETLSSIARTAYGKESAWRAILAANKDKLSDERKLRVGMVIVLPAKP